MIMSRSRLWATAVGVFSFGAAPALAQEQTGGSNYVIVNPDLGKLRGDEAWRDSKVFVPPACGYDRASGKVDEDFREMRSAGQKKMALVIWHMTHAKAVECAGFTVSSNGGQLPPRVMRNLATLLKRAKADGYDEVQVRFAPMGGNSPDRWKKWNQDKFDENWSVISSTAEQLKQGDAPRLVFDLGVELGGRKCDSCASYVTRLWKNYVEKFGPEDSYGFSIAAAPGRVTLLIEALRAGGPLPDEIALDVYKNARNAVARAGEEAKAAGIAKPTFLIQETYYDEPGTLNEIREGASRSGAKIRAIMQWPVTPGANRHISTPRSYGYRYAAPAK